MTRQREPGAGRGAADVATGVVAAALVFVAVPAVLGLLVGDPVPRHLARADLLSARGLFDLLAVVAWIAWVACCWPLLRAVAARVRRRDASPGADARLPDWLAARIAAAVLAVAPLGLAAGSVAGPVAGAAGHRPAAAHGSPVPAGLAAAPSGTEPPPDPTATTAGEPVPATYTVAPGDTLWSIAERFYGDGADWSAIAQANLGLPMGAGARFTDPSLIVPGWVLALPQPGGATPGAAGSVTTSPSPTTAPGNGSATTTLSPASPNRGSGAAGTAAAGSGTGEAGTGEAGTPAAGHLATRPATSPTAGVPGAGHATPPAGTGATASPGIGTTAAAGEATPGAGTRARRARALGTTRRARSGARRRDGNGADTTAAGRRLRPGPRHGAPPSRPVPPGPPPLPELAALGVSVLVAGALARRARRARRAASLARGEGHPPTPVSDLAADTASLLAPFDGVPVLDLLELANRQLATALADAGRAGHVPAARLVRVGPDGVEVRLREAVPWAPTGWSLQGDRAWHLPAGTDLGWLAAEGLGSGPWLPVLLPIGGDHRGTWLVPAGAGTVLPVLGAAAPELLRAMQVAASSWAWSDQLAVTEDAEVAEREAGATVGIGADSDAGTGARVLYVGDPDALPDGIRARCAVLTARPVTATDLTVMVDAHGASVHPLGIIVRPERLDGARGAALDELVHVPEPQPPVTAGETAPGAGTPGTEPDRRRPASRRTASSSRGSRHPSVGITDLLLPGPVEVRLLVAEPRIDGLVEDLPANRARRATEVIAYLALHHPDPVTSDMLRARVLGSADADAAAKTLFNTVGAGRRAMGRDPAGEPMLPLATKAGQYRVSPLVTVDAVRAAGLAAAAGSATSDDEAMALLRAALTLVAGEPMAGILTGYSWWTGEGHEQHFASVLVDAACRLARLASGAGYLDLARWAVKQARLVDPYSETLSRAAMEVAAEAGDAELLRREWVECQRRADELDPGSLPSEVTERRYAELRRRVPAYAGEEPGR